MKKILITSNLYRPNIGGIENSLYFMARAYISAGYEVHLVASSINNFNNSPLPFLEEIDGIKIYRYEGSRFLQRNKNAFELFKTLMNNNTYELFIARSHVPTIILKLAGAKKVTYILPGISIEQNRIKAKVYSPTYLKRLVPHYFHHLMQCIAVKLADENYVFSENMAFQVQKYLKYKGNIKLTKPGIDSKRFSLPSTKDYLDFRKQYNYTDQDIILLGVGRFYDVKGFEYLIHSLSYLPQHFKLLLVGDGDNRSKYHDIAEASNVSERLKIVGPVHDTSTFYKLSNIFVLSSIHEPFGQTLIEALACGLPIVAFDNKLDGIVTATNEVTNSSNSVSIKELSSKAVALAILEAQNLLEQGLFNKANISKDAISKYSWKTMTEGLLL